jgi:hypothetical protein
MAQDGNRNVNPFTNLGKDFIKDLQIIVQKVMIERGLESNSTLVQSVEFTTDNSRDSLYMYVLDYYKYVSGGRKPRVKKVPIYALIQWIKTRGINPGKYSISQLAFILQRSIYIHGIKGKNFIQQIENTVLDVVEVELADTLEEAIADSLYAAFTVKGSGGGPKKK